MDHRSPNSSALSPPRPQTPPSGLESLQEVLNRARAQTLPFLDSDADNVLPVDAKDDDEDDVWPLPERRDDNEDDDDDEFGALCEEAEWAEDFQLVQAISYLYALMSDRSMDKIIASHV